MMNKNIWIVIWRIRKKFDSLARRTKGSNKNNEIKQAVIDYIDLIISTIESDIKIKLAPSTVEKMITDFALDKGYEYKSINLLNLPYGFAYRTEGQDLYGCSVSDPKIRDKLNSLSVCFHTVGYGYVRRRKDVPRQQSKNQLRLFFANHKVHDESHDVNDKESIMMNIVEIDTSSGVNVSTTLFAGPIFLKKTKFINTVKKRERLKKFANQALNG